jgi:hypothetical protein
MQIPMPLYKKNSSFSKEVNNLSCALTGEKAKPSFLSMILGSEKRPEEVNREILRNDFYTSIFEK